SLFHSVREIPHFLIPHVYFGLIQSFSFVSNYWFISLQVRVRVRLPLQIDRRRVHDGDDE
ncbi:hypothetical protein ACJX0J_015348, partial [Zea mays]